MQAEPLVVTSSSPEETRRFAERLGAALDPFPRGGFVVALTGDLGAGKTVFAGGLVRGLGVAPGTVVPSPTFTVFRSYRGRVAVEHVDAYLVTSRAALEGAGLHEIGGDGHLTCVEWADRIPDALPEDRLDVHLDALTLAPPPTVGGPPSPPRTATMDRTPIPLVVPAERDVGTLSSGTDAADVGREPPRTIVARAGGVVSARVLARWRALAEAVGIVAR